MYIPQSTVDIITNRCHSGSGPNSFFVTAFRYPYVNKYTSTASMNIKTVEICIFSKYICLLLQL